MSIETLVLLVIFIVMPLLERLMKILRESQASKRPPAAELPVPPLPPPPARRPRPQPAADRQSSRPDRGSARPPGKPPRRRPTMRPPAEAASLETAAIADVEAKPPTEQPLATPPDGLSGLPRRRRAPRIDLRQPASLQAAIVAQTVLGPCRAARPYDSGPDV